MQGPSLAKDFRFILSYYQQITLRVQKLGRPLDQSNIFFKILLVYPCGHNYTLNDFTEKLNNIYVKGIGLRKEVDWQRNHSIGFALSCSCWNFQTNLRRSYIYCERPKVGQVLFENKQNVLRRAFAVYCIQKLFLANPIPRIRDMLNMVFFS